MAIHWNAEAEARLLMGILTQMQGRLDYKALAAFMGPGCSVPALQTRICKLHREAGVAGSPGKSRTPSTRTPSKSKQAAAESPINQAKRPYHVVDDDDDDDDDDNDKVIKGEKDVKPLIKDEYEDKKLKISFVDLAEC